MTCLSNVLNHEDFKDDSCVSPLSKSLVGGSMNICKTRILNFVEQVQGAVNHIFRYILFVLIYLFKFEPDISVTF